MDSNYLSAIERAKQLAARFAPTDSSSNNNNNIAVGNKRPAEGDESGASAPKQRPTQPGTGMTPPQVNDKLAAAAAVAAQLSQKLGAPSSNSGPGVISGGYNPASGGVYGPVNGAATTVNWQIPDKYVGLMIGKNGEQITRVQADSGCRVQIAQDSYGQPDRQVTLSGTPEQIAKVKALMNEVIEKAEKATAHYAPNNYAGGAPGVGSTTVNGTQFVELMVPGLKVGLVIGKGGETIKKLQEECGVKMVMIQESNQATIQDKPLRISGEPSKVDRAKKMVMELMNSRDSNPPAGTVAPTRPMHHMNPNAQQTTYAVPAEKAGMIIGKGGETIRDICRLSGAFVAIQKQPPPDPSIKIFDVSGEQSQIDEAIRLICEKAGLPPPGGSVYAGYGATAWSGTAAAAAAAWSGATTAATTGTMPPPTINPVTGQPDYSAAWAEYYRSIGYPEYADAILRQAASGGSGIQQAPTVPTPAAPSMSAQQSSVHAGNYGVQPYGEAQTGQGATAGGYGQTYPPQPVQPPSYQPSVQATSGYGAPAAASNPGSSNTQQQIPQQWQQWQQWQAQQQQAQSAQPQQQQQQWANWQQQNVSGVPPPPS